MVCAGVCERVCCVHMCGMYACACAVYVLRREMLGIISEKNEQDVLERCARKKMLHFFPPMHLKK